MVSWHRERQAEVVCGWRLPMGIAAVARGIRLGMSGGFRPGTSGRGLDSGGAACEAESRGGSVRIAALSAGTLMVWARAGMCTTHGSHTETAC
jgi:hypothetical protein